MPYIFKEILASLSSEWFLHSQKYQKALNVITFSLNNIIITRGSNPWSFKVIMESKIKFSIMLQLLLIFNTLSPSIAIDTITQTQFVSGSENQFLVSSNGNFKLGFFSPGKSPSRYVGIWFNKVSPSKQ